MIGFNNKNILKKNHRAHGLNICEIAICSLTLVLGTTMTFSATPLIHATDANTSFQVNVADSLAVSVTAPATWATGDIDTFLRNKVSIEVVSNDSAGFTASMYSEDSTDLTNVAKSTFTIPTLADQSTRSDFPSDYWGYSLGVSSLAGRNYNETDAGNSASVYYPLVATSASPITILQAAEGTYSGTQDIYFGAKASVNKASGTYTGTVLISVVTGTVTTPSDNPNDNPITPVNPATNNDTTEGHATYDGVNDRTVYYSTTVASDTVSTTTEVSKGNTTSSYAAPAGVTTKTSSNINSGSIALGLATTASVAAASGIFFFILAKRREEDEDEEEENL